MGFFANGIGKAFVHPDDHRQFRAAASASLLAHRHADESVAVRVVGTSVLAIRNAIVVTVMIAAIRCAIMIPAVSATIPVWAVVNDAAGQKAADGDQQHSKFFHVIPQY